METARDNRWALLIAGISGDKALQEEYLRQLRILRGLLTGAMRLPEDRVVVLVDDPAAAPDLTPFKATRDGLVEAVRRLSDRVAKEDQVFVFIAGHGSSDGRGYRLNLVGPDPTGDELAALLYSIPARQFIVVNTTSCSGGSVEDLSGPGKIVVSATRSGVEKNRTHMGRYFAEALVENAGDVDKNGRVSILEAFEYASRRVEEHYTKEGNLQTEHPVLDDSGDGKAHARPSPENGDGLLARTAYLDTGATERGEGIPSAEERRLVAAAQELEGQIQALKYAKATISEEEYEKRLESLLLKLAEVSAKLKKK
ncbi:MAG: hypothetical protein HXY20_07010 [Acidobacteria bacterium]|nr:hypothetical protein [Acidobacteriota bacterium]